MSGPAANAGSSTNEGANERLRWRGFWGRLLIAVLIASACMTSAVALVDRGITDRVADIQRVVIPQLAPAPPGGANYLIIGSDTRAFVNNSGDAAAFGDPKSDPTVEGQRSDTLMVAHIEPSAQRTFVVSFPRDLMVNVPGTPGLSMINSAYSTGGPELVARHAQAPTSTSTSTTTSRSTSRASRRSSTRSATSGCTCPGASATSSSAC